MISLHADHVISPAVAFRELMQRTAKASIAHGRLFTVGAVPTRPETGYGYICAGEQLEAGMFVVDEFVEKPDPATAERYMAEGYLWNTGLFVWPVSLFLDQLREHTPEIAEHLPLLEAGAVAEYFARVPVTTIDEGLMERSGRVAVARATFEWDDVGTWDAVSRTRETDGAGNVVVGDAHVVDSTDCITWAEEGTIVVYGAADLIVVRTRDITLVAPRERAPQLKKLLEQLPDRLVEPDGAS
jgi:mannose-1-phosphate guanylyltransferase